MKQKKTTTGVPQENGKFRHTCICGLDATVPVEEVHHMCDGAVNACEHLGIQTHEKFPPETGLGDWVAEGLKKFGITPESYAGAKEQIGLGKDCKCGWRQKLLNRVTEMAGLGKGQGQELQSILAIDHLPRQHTHFCKLHEKCLPSAKVSAASREALCGLGYHPCTGCHDKKVT